MKRHPIALSAWKAKVQEVQDRIRPQGLSRTAEQLRNVMGGNLSEDEVTRIVLLACAEAQNAGLSPMTIFLVATQIASLLRDLKYLQPVDYCACERGRRRFARDDGAEVSDGELPLCIACNGGIRKQVVAVKVVQ